MMIKDHLMVIAAFRYCLGRRTYIVSHCVEWLTVNWDQIIPNARDVIQLEIKEAIDMGWAGDLCDVQEWEKILSLPKPDSPIQG